MYWRKAVLGGSDTNRRNTCSGVACRAFPGGRPAHPEPHIEEENEENLRKDERKSRRMRKNLGNVAFLPTRGWDTCYVYKEKKLSWQGASFILIIKDENLLCASFNLTAEKIVIAVLVPVLLLIIFNLSGLYRRIRRYMQSEVSYI